MWVLEDWGKTVTTINLGIEICPEMHAVIKITMVKICKNHQIQEHSLSLTKSVDIHLVLQNFVKSAIFVTACMFFLPFSLDWGFSHKLQIYIWRGSFQLSVIKVLLESNDWVRLSKHKEVKVVWFWTINYFSKFWFLKLKIFHWKSIFCESFSVSPWGK